MFCVDSETGPLREVLLCRPEYYRWQPTNAVAHRTLADGQSFDEVVMLAQYDEFLDALGRAGVTCRFLDPKPHLPYMVYTRDSSQTTPWGPVITQLFRPQRRGEYASVIEFYAEHGGIWHYADQGTLEGGDIHIIRPGLALIGHSGERTDEAGAEQFADWLEDHGWEVRLQPFAAHFLHLDLLFCMVADGLAVACLDVLDPDLIGWLRGRQIHLIDVPYRDAMALGCNLLALGDDRVLSPHASQDLNVKLRAEGLEVLAPHLDVFTRGGGGAHCMTMPLARDPV